METANKILDKAMKLPEEEWAFIAEKLFQSLPSHLDGEIESAWKEEIDKRLEEIEAGKVKLINWDDVKKKSQ